MLSIFKVFLPKLLKLVLQSKSKILIGLTTIFIILASTFLYYKKNEIPFLPEGKKENTMDILIRSSKADEILAKKLQELKALSCTAIAVFQYHNGIYLKSNNSLLKSTITNLVVEENYKDVWDVASLQGVSLTVFGKDFLKLVKNEVYLFQNNDPDISYSVKSRLYFTKSESVISIIIKNTKSEPIGNISIYFAKKIDISQINKKTLKELSEKISFELIGKKVLKNKQDEKD